MNAYIERYGYDNYSIMSVVFIGIIFTLMSLVNIKPIWMMLLVFVFGFFVWLDVKDWTGEKMNDIQILSLGIAITFGMFIAIIILASLYFLALKEIVRLRNRSIWKGWNKQQERLLLYYL